MQASAKVSRIFSMMTHFFELRGRQNCFWDQTGRDLTARWKILKIPSCCHHYACTIFERKKTQTTLWIGKVRNFPEVIEPKEELYSFSQLYSCGYGLFCIIAAVGFVSIRKVFFFSLFWVLFVKTLHCCRMMSLRFSWFDHCFLQRHVKDFGLIANSFVKLKTWATRNRIFIYW